MSRKRLSRRDFLTGAVGVVGVGVLAACSPRTVEVEKVVEQTVEVEVPVAQTVVVEVASDPVVIEKLVEVEREIIRTAGEPYWSPPDLSGEEFLIWGLQFDPHVEAYHRLAGVFEEHTGAVATVEPLGWPLEEHIITGMAAGLVPDVCCIMGQRIVGLIGEDAIFPVDDLVYDMVGCDIDAWFGPVAIQAYQYFGQTWGVPTEGNCVSGVANLRMDFMEEADADIQALWPPTAGLDGFYGFEDMWAIAEALQRQDEDGTVTRWGLSATGWESTHLLGIMRTLGVDWWDPASRAFNLASDAALEAMQFLVVRPVFDLGIETQLQEPCTDAQFAGKVAVCTGNVTNPGIGRTNETPIDGCIYPSAIPGRDALFVGEGGWGFVAPTQGENVDVGVEFLKFLSTYEGQKEYCRIYGGIVSACLAVNDDDELFPAGDLVGDAMRRSGKAQARTVYYGSGFGTPSEMTQIVSTAVVNVRTGDQQPEEALTEAQALLEEMLVRWDAENA